MYETELEKYKDNILALDTASRKTGYAIYKDGKILDSGVWVLKPNENFLDLYRHIRNAVKTYDINVILAEDVFKVENKTNAYEVLCECRGIVQLCAQQLKLQETRFISPLRVKQMIWDYNPKAKKTHRNFTRTQQKNIMIRFIKNMGYMSQDNTSDDEADAIGLLIAFFKIWGYALPVRKY